MGFLTLRHLPVLMCGIFSVKGEIKESLPFPVVLVPCSG